MWAKGPAGCCSVAADHRHGRDNNREQSHRQTWDIVLQLLPSGCQLALFYVRLCDPHLCLSSFLRQLSARPASQPSTPALSRTSWPTIRRWSQHSPHVKLHPKFHLKLHHLELHLRLHHVEVHLRLHHLDFHLRLQLDLHPRFHHLDLQPRFHHLELQLRFHHLELHPRFHQLDLQPRFHHLDLQPRFHHLELHPRFHQLDLHPRFHHLDLQPRFHHLELQLRFHHLELHLSTMHRLPLKDPRAPATRRSIHIRPQPPKLSGTCTVCFSSVISWLVIPAWSHHSTSATSPALVSVFSYYTVKK